MTTPLNLMWKILKLPDSSACRSPGYRSRHFYSTKSNPCTVTAHCSTLQRWILLQHLDTVTASWDTCTASGDTFTASGDTFTASGYCYSIRGLVLLQHQEPPEAVHLNFQTSGNWRWRRWPESSRVSITAETKIHITMNAFRNGVAVLIPISKYLMATSGIFIFFFKCLQTIFWKPLLQRQQTDNRMQALIASTSCNWGAFASTPWLEGCGSAGTTTKQLQLLQYVVYGMGCRSWNFKTDFR